jgi:hypothetical protein
MTAAAIAIIVSDHITPMFLYMGIDAIIIPPENMDRRKFTVANADADQIP